jgi:hypothetical protein
MKKKLLLVALACMALAFTSSAFAQSCAGTPVIQAIVVGSSAQFNSMAYAVEDILGGTGNYNLFSVKGITTDAGGNPAYTAAIQDIRSGTNGALDSATLWVIWDNNTNCNVYAYYSVDSTVGNRAYFASVAYKPSTATISGAGVWPCFLGQSTSPCNGAAGLNLTTSGFCISSGGSNNCAQNQVGGQNDTVAAPNDVLPTTVYTALTTVVTPTATNKPPAYCGQLAAANSANNFFCYFNAAATDIRPEDAYFATGRALAVPAAGLVGLDYASTNCKAGANATCQIYDSFGGNGTFNALKFNLTLKDPYDTTAAVPGYTTLSVGASPVLVTVANADTTAAGLGNTYTDVNGKSVYLFNDILRKKLAFIFEGSTYCTGDILPGAALGCEGHDSKGNAIPYGCGIGSGNALQVVQREPLSGTYNTFEFTGIRTLSGSTGLATSKPTTLAWTSDDDGGQEMWAAAAAADSPAFFPYQIDPGNVNMGWNAGTLATACGGPIANLAGINVAGVPTGAQNCSDPLFISGANLTRPPNCKSGTYLRLRAIGTGQEVPDTLALKNKGAAVVSDGIGYAFWSYGNFAKSWASGAAVGHYLTVDSVDPLFATEGGYYDRTDGVSPNDFPNCDGGTSSSIALPCTNTIPFTHIYDGKYPLWSLLRVVTFPNATGKSQVPPGILNLVAYDQQEVTPAKQNTADFVPFLTNLVNSGTLTAPVWKGDLNLGVFRVHFKQATSESTITPANGHAQCAGVFTSVNLQGGSAHSAACLVDTGSDVGGSVMTVQDDVDFNVDFGGTTTETVALPATYEEYGLRQ